MATSFLDTSAIIKRYIFVCADVSLLDIAGAEGLQAENPNDYP